MTVLSKALAGNLILAVLVALLARLSFATAEGASQMPIIWLPAGLAVGAVLRWGFGALPGVIVGGLWPDLMPMPGLLSGAGLYARDLDPAGRSGLAAAISLDTVLGVYLIRRFVGRGDPFRHVSGTVKALFLGGLAGSLPGIILFSLVPAVSGSLHDSPAVAFEFILAHCSGLLVLAPLVLFDPKARPDENRPGAPWWEATLIWVGIAAATAMMIAEWPVGPSPLVDPILFALAAWAAVRLAYPFPVLVAGLAGAVLVFGTATGIGPMNVTGWASPSLLASAHQVVISLLALLLAALASVQRTARAAVERGDELLRQLQALAKHSPDSGILVYDRSMRVQVARVSSSIPLPFEPDAAEGKLLAELNLPGWLDRVALYQAPLAGQTAEAEFLLYGRTFRAYFLPVFIGDGTVTSGIAIWQDVSEKRRLERELRESESRLQELARHLMALREEDRTRIARIVHDAIGQTLTGIKLDVAWLARRCGRTGGAQCAKASAEVAARLADLIVQADQAVAQARDLAKELRPGVLDHLGLAAAIAGQAHDYRARSELDINLTAGDGRLGLERDAETSIFRVFQELMHNAVRHSNATHVWITLDHDADGVILEVEDDGVGYAAPEDKRGFGLDDIRERARQLGGTFEIQGEPGQGTRAVLRVPIEGKTAAPSTTDPTIQPMAGIGAGRQDEAAAAECNGKAADAASEGKSKEEALP